MLGRDDDDPLFLQVKEAQASVLEPFLGTSEYDNHGQRVVEGQRLMQAASDIMLGWLRTTGIDGVERDYYVRQLWDAKGSALVELMEPTRCWRLRQALRLDARPRPRPLGRRGRDRRLPRQRRRASTAAMAAFAEAYADQNERDYAALAEAVERPHQGPDRRLARAAARVRPRTWKAGAPRRLFLIASLKRRVPRNAAHPPGRTGDREGRPGRSCRWNSSTYRVEVLLCQFQGATFSRRRRQLVGRRADRAAHHAAAAAVAEADERAVVGLEALQDELLAAALGGDGGLGNERGAAAGDQRRG